MSKINVYYSPKYSVIVTSSLPRLIIFIIVGTERSTTLEVGHLGGEREGGGLPQASVQSRGGAHIGGEEEEEENGTPDAVEKMNLLEAVARR